MSSDNKNLIKTHERDIYLAKAMGWRYVPPGTWAKPEDETTWTHSAPWFHEWEIAKAKLLRWMAADDARWGRFVQVLLSEGDHWEMGWSRFLVTLTPAQVAEAAEPVCNQCAKRKLRLVAKDGFASALIDIRQIAKPGHEHPAEQRTGEV